MAIRHMWRVANGLDNADLNKATIDQRNVDDFKISRLIKVKLKMGVMGKEPTSR